MPDGPRNITASVRARLLSLAKQRNQPFDLLLTRYVLERLLYRLGSTRHRERFVLKGAMLLTTWLDDPFRPTRDLDLLGFGDPDPTALLETFKEICAIAASDAVVFDISSLAVDRIREETEYGGVRIKGHATVDTARVRILIDIAFGDAIEPGLEETDLPVLLDFPAPRLRCYPREAVIAEKLQAMVVLGLATSRMKDFYDIWVLSRSCEFKGDALARAIAATFARRKTDIPAGRPDALSSAFAADRIKQEQWAAFVKDVAVRPGSFAEVVDSLADFLMPHMLEARKLMALGAQAKG
jgi:predicted nucleotidyltransferase component of viral defense system